MDINKKIKDHLEENGLKPNAEGLYDNVGIADFKSLIKECDTLYGFYYCPCIHESAAGLMSLHRTEKGAQMAMEFHKAEEEKEFNEIRDGYEGKWDIKFGRNERWFVNKIEIEE